MKILLLADIHIGSINDTQYVDAILTDILQKEAYSKKVDMIIILGDFFDRTLNLSSDSSEVAFNIMHQLSIISKLNNTQIRIIYGTESHEMNQYKSFNHYIKENDNIKIINKVYEENINGKSILYIPEEYIYNKHEYYKDTLYNDNKFYDYIFLHGMISDALPQRMRPKESKDNNKERKVPHFNCKELSDKCKLCVAGHYHIHTSMNNVHYLGSLFRSCFGEEEPKGYGIINDDKLTFIENSNALIYTTYKYDEDNKIYHSENELIKEINHIKDKHKDLFNNEVGGKIRLIFNLPSSTSIAFKEVINNLLKNDKKIQVVIKANNDALLDTVKNEVESKWNYLLDPKLSIISKISNYIKDTNDIEIKEDEINKYIGEVI